MSIFELWNIYQNRDTTRLRQSWITLLTWSILKGRGDSRGSGPIRNIATKNRKHHARLRVMLILLYLFPKSLLKLGEHIFVSQSYRSHQRTLHNCEAGKEHKGAESVVVPRSKMVYSQIDDQEDSAH